MPLSPPPAAVLHPAALHPASEDAQQFLASAALSASRARIFSSAVQK